MLNLSAENLVLMALKTFSPTHPLEGEDSSSQRANRELVLRCYKCHGKSTNLQLQGDLDWQFISEVDGLEAEINTTVDSMIRPWQVRSFRLFTN